MATDKPPTLRSFLARVIAAKSGEHYALEPSPLLCGECREPMPVPESAGLYGPVRVITAGSAE